MAQSQITQPEEAQIAYTKGILAFDEERYAEALEHFLAGLKAASDDPTLNLYAGITLIALEREAEAVAHLRRALELDPSLHEAHYHLGLALYRSRQLEEAVASFREAQKYFPDEGVLYYYEGLCLLELGRLEDSIDPFEKAASIDPAFRMRARFYSGSALYGLSKPEEARTAFNDALELEPPKDLKLSVRRYLEAIEEARKPARPYRLSFYGGFDYDDNVVAEPNAPSIPGLFKRSDDGRAVLGATLDYWKLFNESLTAGFQYTTYGRIHGNLSSYNISYHRPLVYLQAKLDPFQVRGEYEYTYSFLGNKSSLQIHAFGPTLMVPIKQIAFFKVDFRFRDKLFFESDLQNSDEYLLTANAYFFPFGQSSYLRLGYSLSEDRAVGREFDSQADILSGGFYVPLPWKTTFSADAYMEMRDYDNDYFGLGVRDDNILTVPVRLVKSIDERLAIVLSYTGIKSDSNIGDLDYDENIYSMGFQFTY